MVTSTRIAEILNGKLYGDPSVSFQGCGMDSRKIKPGELFVAIQGEQTDGHRYITNAYEAGASIVLAEADKIGEKTLYGHGYIDQLSEGKALIAVRNSIEALQLLAKSVIQEARPIVVGVTGSTGKTTTKDMIASVLAQKYKVHKNQENYNNEIGLPLTILNAPKDTQVMVLEMGMRGLGQIRQLCEIGNPHVGVITNIGTTHMELLGSQENIAKAKWEIIESLPEDGVAILNAEDYYSVIKSSETKLRKLFYGIQGQYIKPDLYAQNVIPKGSLETSFDVYLDREKAQVNLPLPGEHNVLDGLAALAVGTLYGISLEKGAQALANLEMSKMRLEILDGIYNSIIINDVYNANPASMKASLRVLAERGGERTIAVLGEMYELGDQSVTGHREVGETVAGLEIQRLITVGKMAEDIAQGALDAGFQKEKIHICKDCEEAARITQIQIKNLGANSWVLVKGSRGMKMEQVSCTLQEP